MFRALVLCGFATFATSISAQSTCSKGSSSECSAKTEASAKTECSAQSEAKLAVATGDSECASAKAATCTATQAKQCEKGAAKLAAAADGHCDGAGGASCHGKLASAKDGQQCSSQDQQCNSQKLAKLAIPTSAKLAALIQPSRVAGVVVGGKAYLGPKAIAVVDGLLREQVGTKIASVCEESAKCSKTLASNVDKTLASGFCVKSGFAALLESGRIDSLIISNESASGEAALASLTEMTSCPKFQAECQMLASAPAKGECSSAAGAKGECAMKAGATKECSMKEGDMKECSMKEGSMKDCPMMKAGADAEGASQASVKPECSSKKSACTASTSTIQ